MALLCVSLLLCQRRASEKWFYVVARWTFSVIIYSLDLLLTRWLSRRFLRYETLFASISLYKFTSNCGCMFTLHVLHSNFKACDNLRMRGRTSRSARNILNDVRTSTTRCFAMYLDKLYLDICLEHCRLVFRKPIFMTFKNRKLVVFKLREFWDPNSSFIDRSCVQEQQLYIEIIV